jgi:hypothetical protein
VSRPRAALAAAAVLLALPAAPRAGPLTDPLGAGTPGPFRQLFLDPVLADARAVTRAGTALRLELANHWSVPTVLRRGDTFAAVDMDAQGDALALSARLPWALAGDRLPAWRGRVATTLALRLTGYWGGYTDGGIEAWHHLIHAFNFSRQIHPRDRLHLRLGDAAGRSAFDVRSGGAALGDLVVGTQVLVASGGAARLEGGAPRWGVALRADLKLPTGSLPRAGGSGGVDGALSALVTRELAGWLVLHGRASFSVVSPLAAGVALQPRRLHAGFEVSAVAVAGGWAFLLEDRVASPLMEGGWTVLDGGDDDRYESSAGAALFRAHNQITGAVRRGEFTLAFAEDWTPGWNPRGAAKWFFDSNAPDVLLSFTWARAW